jgi:hypothetical protein
LQRGVVPVLRQNPLPVDRRFRHAH